MVIKTRAKIRYHRKQCRNRTFVSEQNNQNFKIKFKTKFKKFDNLFEKCFCYTVSACCANEIGRQICLSIFQPR